jgi:hypothetical protein
LDVVQFLLVLLVLAAVVALVSAPLRRPGAGEEKPESDLPALEAAKEAKYREIRDADLDHRTGKLSDEDWRAMDAQLRAEAMEILRRIDRAGG